MEDASITVTEGINGTFPICVRLESLSGNLTKSISVSLATRDIGTANGKRSHHHYVGIKTSNYI